MEDRKTGKILTEWCQQLDWKNFIIGVFQRISPQIKLTALQNSRFSRIFFTERLSVVVFNKAQLNRCFIVYVSITNFDMVSIREKKVQFNNKKPISVKSCWWKGLLLAWLASKVCNMQMWGIPKDSPITKAKSKVNWITKTWTFKYQKIFYILILFNYIPCQFIYGYYFLFP